MGKFCPGIVDFQVLPCVMALRTFNEQSETFCYSVKIS